MEVKPAPDAKQAVPHIFAATFVSKIQGCARCQKDHVGVEFRPLLNSDCSHWGMCPETKQPILLWFEADLK